MERAYLAAGFDHDSGTPEYDAAEAEQMRITKAQDPYVDIICETRAVTREGQVARARSQALSDAEMFKREPCYTNERITATIVRDLIGEAGA